MGVRFARFQSRGACDLIDLRPPVRISQIFTTNARVVSKDRVR